jgi:formylglycine-generating enzyme required for sulfatase activity
MDTCPELAETPAARRLVDLSETSEQQGLLEVHRYLGFQFREDHETLRDSFFEARRRVTREWDEEEDSSDDLSGSAEVKRVVHHVEQEAEFQFLNGLGEVLATYRGAPGSRKEFPMSAGDASLRMAVRWIPPGRFLMGSPIREPGREPDEVMHTVILPDGFFLSETPCTQAQWSLFMPDNPSRFRGADLPVEQVNWEEAREFARRLTETHLKAGLIASGWHWDLPTEAQWEYACRTRKPGEFHGPIEAVAWYHQNSAKRTHPVGGKQPNAWGLQDMHGNVGKWCLDWYGPYPVGEVTDPAGPSFGTFRVYRGGGWSDVARCCRSAYRGRSVPDFRSSNIGFSLVLSGPRGGEPEVAATSR